MPPPTFTPTVTATASATGTVETTVTAEPTFTITTVCVPEDNSSRRTELDHTAKQQERVIVDALRGVGKALRDRDDRASRRILKQREKLLVTAHTLQLDNWKISWTGPKTDDNCPQSQACATFVYTSLKAQYKTQADQLRSLLDEAIKLRKQVRKLHGRDVLGALRKDRKYKKRADQEHQKALSVNNTVPETSKNC